MLCLLSLHILSPQVSFRAGRSFINAQHSTKLTRSGVDPGIISETRRADFTFIATYPKMDRNYSIRVKTEGNDQRNGNMKFINKTLRQRPDEREER